MSFQMIHCRAKQERVEPYVTVSKTSVTFNPAAVVAVGAKNTRCVAFFDKEKNMLAFTFFTGKLIGSYSFRNNPKVRTRRIGLKTFFEVNGVVERMKGPEFPLEVLEEEIPDYEGSVIFVINLNRSE